MKKVLILTGSYGGGHNAAASSLKDYYETKGYQAKVVDIIDFVNKFLAKSTKEFYKVSSEDYPKIWETFFNVTDYPIVARLLYGIKDPIGQPKFDKMIEKFQPDKVISVFPFWNWWVKNYIKSKGHNFSWGIFITDAINIQSFWYVRDKYVDKYFVIDEFSKNEFIKKFDYPEDKVVVSFFPFQKNKFINKKQIKNDNVLLLLTGLEADFVDNFLSKTNKNIIVLKGRNKELFDYLKIKYFDRFKFLDFLPILDNLKDIDLLIGKCGGALTCECIATDTPLLVPNYFPGQEEGNLLLLQKTETGIFESNPEKMNFLINYVDWNKFLPNFQKVKKISSLGIIDSNLTKKNSSN